jgi:hypothetical protein
LGAGVELQQQVQITTNGMFISFEPFLPAPNFTFTRKSQTFAAHWLFFIIIK